MQSKYSVTHHVFFVCTQLFIAQYRIMAVVVVVCGEVGWVRLSLAIGFFQKLILMLLESPQLPPCPPSH